MNLLLLMLLPVFIHMPSYRRSFNNIPPSRSAGSTDPFVHHTPSLSSKRPGSSLTPDQTHSKPKLRARGMTDGGGTQKAGFFTDEPLPSRLSKKSSTSTFTPPISSTEHVSPRVVVQQPSLSRIFAPPCAPPVHSLPATPHSPMKVSSPMQWSNRFARTQSISSSCVSFVSSSSNEILPTLSYPLHSERSVFSQDHNSPEILSTPVKGESKTVSSSPQRLKKAISHQSLDGNSNIQSPLFKLPPDNRIDKMSHKQRTFHPRSPMSPILDPVDQPISASSSIFPDFGPKTAVERRTKRNCRKRLLSHSNVTRPSTSQCTPTPALTEDDSQSVFSLRSDPCHHLAPSTPLASPKSIPQSLFGEEAGSPVPSSPAPSEYVPKPILSPAQVAKLEASVEDTPDRSIRSRALSLLSTSTIASDLEDHFMLAGLSPPPTPRSRSRERGTRAKSLSARTPAFHSSTSNRARSPPCSLPPPNNGTSENVFSSPKTSRPFSSELSTELATSLPPPPRSRQRSQLNSHPECSNIVPSNSSFVSKPSRFKSTIENLRPSIMRKPSFLEIDDDTDIDMFSEEAMTGSFLDLARESFEINSNEP